MPAATSRSSARSSARSAARVRHSSTHTRPRLAGLLIIGPLLCVIALTGLAYIGLSQQVNRDTLAQVGIAAQAAHGALQANMGDVKVANGQLASALPANVTTLNNNNAEAKQLHAQVGVNMLIAQREQGTLVVVASSLTSGPSGAAVAGLGERLSGAFAEGACATGVSGTNTGTITVAGASYMAGSAPLVDGGGACIGAIIALTPLSALQSVALEYTVILAMAGALLALLTTAVGLMLNGRAGETAHMKRLSAAMVSLTRVEAAYAAQLSERERISRRLTTGRHHLQRLLATMANDRLALQDATSDIWAGVSHPGAPVDPATAMRLAREGAVVAARVGSRLDDFDAVTNALVADLTASDDVDATLGDALAQTTAAIDEIRAALGLTPEDARTSAATSLPRRPAAPSDPYATNLLAAQRRRTGQTPAVSPHGAPRQTGGYRALRADSAQHRAVDDHGATGQTPAAGQSMHGRRPGSLGASGLYRQQRPASSGGHHSAGNPPQPFRQTPRPNFNPPMDGRDRDASGSHWLND